MRLLKGLLEQSQVRAVPLHTQFSPPSNNVSALMCMGLKFFSGGNTGQSQRLSKSLIPKRRTHYAANQVLCGTMFLRADM